MTGKQTRLQIETRQELEKIGDSLNFPKGGNLGYYDQVVKYLINYYLSGKQCI